MARHDLALGLGVAQRTNSEQGRTVPVPAGVAGRQAERCDKVEMKGRGRQDDDGK